MKLYLASNNPHKAAEFQALADAAKEAGAPRIECLPAAALGGMPAVVEDAGSFVGNARKKVLALVPRLPPGSWALADDSGLCVDALGGAPGVESAYFAGPEGDDAANLAKLVRELREVPEGRRGARFVCVLALLGPQGHERIFEGRCEGRLACEPHGARGFGYDPLFIPEGTEQTFAELPSSVKNRIGHRGRAWAALIEGLARSNHAQTETPQRKIKP